VGYKVHLTETCEDDTPDLITHVETTPAPVADGALTPAIHAALEDKQLLPGQHLLDTGYLDAELFATIPQAYEVELIGPTRPDVKAQARARPRSGRWSSGPADVVSGPERGPAPIPVRSSGSGSSRGAR